MKTLYTRWGKELDPEHVSAADDAAEKLCELKRILGLPDL